MARVALWRGGGGAAALLATATALAGCGLDGGDEQAQAGASRVAGSVRSAQEIVDRARDPDSEGKVFEVRRGDYGQLDLRGIARRRTVTFRAAPGPRPRIGYTTMGDTAGIRLQGLRFVGAIDIQPGDNERIAIVGNDIGGYTGVGVSLRERSRDILIANNRFHDLRERGGDYAAGYGLRVSSPEVEIADLRVTGNVFERLGNDALEIGGVDGALIERNTVRGVEIEPGSAAHSDPLFVWAGSRHVRIRRNRFVGNSQPVYLRGGTADVVFDNNLVARSDNWCMQVGGNGPGDDINGLAIRNNTIWDCGFGGILHSGRGDGWTLVNNIVESLGVGTIAGDFAIHRSNLVPGGGRADIRRRPRFVNQAAGNYRLAPHSPGIDAGTSVGVPRRDLLGRRRWDDRSVPNRGSGPRRFYDVGAFERRARAARR